MNTRVDQVQYTEYGIPIRNLWHMLMYAWNEAPLKRRQVPESVERAPSLDALFAAVLVRSMRHRMRIGLGRGYVQEHAALRGVRGRIDFPGSLRDRSFERGEAWCDFEAYSADEPANRIIRSTLARLVQAGQFGPEAGPVRELRHNLRSLVRDLEGIALVDLHPEAIARQRSVHRDRDYRLILAICELVARRHMPLETDGGFSFRLIDRDELMLPRVYERFVANFYRIHLTGWEVAAQKRLEWHASESNVHLPAMIPDLVLCERSSGRLVVLDTKFTPKSLVENRWGRDLYDSSHLYQLYAYLKSQAHVSAAHARAEGILLYPSIETGFSERIQLQDHVIRIESVDLAAPWETIEGRLLDLFQPALP